MLMRYETFPLQVIYPRCKTHQNCSLMLFPSSRASSAVCDSLAAMACACLFGSCPCLQHTLNFSSYMLDNCSYIASNIALCS